MLRIQLIDAMLDRQVNGVDWHRGVIQSTAIQPQQLRLRLQHQFVALPFQHLHTLNAAPGRLQIFFEPG